MDSRVAARFFRVSEKPDGATDFHDLLLQCVAKAKRIDRQHEVDAGVVLRVERCKPAPTDFVVGVSTPERKCIGDERRKVL